MDPVLLIITIVGGLIGIAAGIVQVLQYFQDRKKRKQEQIENIPPREDILSSGPTDQDDVKHNLPHPDYKNFIGRNKEIDEVISILSDKAQSQADLISIHGIGGIGKSAIAIEIAYRLFWSRKNSPSKEGFDAIIWTSTRTSIYTPEKIVSYVSTENILNLLCITIATTLNHPELIKLSVAEQHEAIRHLLTNQKTLLIVDNVDQPDNELHAFLLKIPEPTKVIMTTRQPRDKPGFPVEYHQVQLGSLISRDARALIRSEKYRRGVALSKDEIRDFHTKTWGNPLAIVLAMAQIAEGLGVQNILNRLGEKTDDIARYCFESALEHIRNTNSWKILMALSLFPSGTNRDVLGAITELSVEEMDEGLKKLRQLSLINQTTPPIFWMLPLLVEYAQKEFSNSPPNVNERIKHNFAKTYMNIKIESALAAKGFIHAVHLAIDLSDLSVWDSRIASYLVANQKAVERGVKIVRIFVLDKRLTYLDDQNIELHPEIIRILDDQLKIKIDVRILWKDIIKENNLVEPPDMIIFDAQELHLHKGHGGWYYEVNISMNVDEIDTWEKAYQTWLDYSIKWDDLRTNG